MQNKILDKLLYYVEYVSDLYANLNTESKTIFGVLFLIAFIFSITGFFLLKKNKSYKAGKNIIDKLLNETYYSNGSNASINTFLKIISEVIPSQTYSFYVKSANNNYILRALKDAASDKGGITPSYDGLPPYKGEIYAPKQNVDFQSVPSGPEIIEEGNLKIISIPTRTKKCLLRIGPVKGKQKGLINTLAGLVKAYENYIEAIIENDFLKSRHEELEKRISGSKNISNMISDYKVVVSNLLNSAINAVSGKGGAFLLYKKSGVEVVASSGIKDNAAKIIENNSDFTDYIKDCTGNNNMAVLAFKQLKSLNIPDFFNVLEVNRLFVFKSYSDIGPGILLLWQNNGQIKEYRITALLIISRIICNTINHNLKFKQLTISSVDMLKSLSQVMDNLTHYTIGRSELTSRFSLIIGNEMGLDKKTLYDLSMAAFLSNIGIIGISEDIFLKQGKYAKTEYELMKLHCDIGASIVESTTGNKNASKYILQHHERIDGNGYPNGLKGGEIELPARIISVVQTFLAKIKGREDREPLSFETALDLIKSSSSSQLDKDVVETLTQWFNKKREPMLNVKKSLGPCWEMLCIPEEICSSCPAYRNTEINCWENAKNNCKGHGDNCETCYVHTEYLSRIKLRSISL